MGIHEVHREHTADPDAIKDPKIVQVAKLAIILADTGIEDITKLACLKLGVKTGIVTEDEAAALLMYRKDLEEVLNHEDPEDE